MRYAPAGSLREVEHAGYHYLHAVEFKFERGGARAQRDNAGLAGATTQDPRFGDVAVGLVDAAEGDEAGGGGGGRQRGALPQEIIHGHRPRRLHMNPGLGLGGRVMYSVNKTLQLLST